MRRRVLALLVLAAGCRTPEAFSAGHPVHFLIRAEPRPAAEVVVRPSVSVGRLRAEAVRTFSPEGPAAYEVAVLRVPSGEHEISVREPETGADRRMTEDVGHETWVILTIDPRKKDARLCVQETPPHEIGPWEPLVPIPD